jgi:8-hydroxy-5-deazaflavin:NADPH oxidoreductase
MYLRAGAAGMRVAVVGTGNVGKSLGEGLARTGHDVRYGSRDPKGAPVPKGARVGSVREVTEWGEAVILAVPFSAVNEVVQSIGASSFQGKTVVDVTNVLTPSFDWALGFTTSGAEELAKLLPGAHVVKAFNTVFSPYMSSGRLLDERLTAFVAGDDPSAKQRALRLASDLGFDAVDAGPLQSARMLEPLGVLNIHLAFRQQLGVKLGIKLIHGNPASESAGKP